MRKLKRRGAGVVKGLVLTGLLVVNVGSNTACVEKTKCLGSGQRMLKLDYYNQDVKDVALYRDLQQIPSDEDFLAPGAIRKAEYSIEFFKEESDYVDNDPRCANAQAAALGAPQTWTFGAWRDGKSVGTATLILNFRMDGPSTYYFGDVSWDGTTLTVSRLKIGGA